MSAPLPSALRARFQRYIEEGLSRRAAAVRLKLSLATGARWRHQIQTTGRADPAGIGKVECQKPEQIRRKEQLQRSRTGLDVPDVQIDPFVLRHYRSCGAAVTFETLACHATRAGRVLAPMDAGRASTGSRKCQAWSSVGRARSRAAASWGLLARPEKL